MVYYVSQIWEAIYLGDEDDRFKVKIVPASDCSLVASIASPFRSSK